MRSSSVSALTNATNNAYAMEEQSARQVSSVYTPTSPDTSLPSSLNVQIDLNQILLSTVGEYRLTYLVGGRQVTVGSLRVNDETLTSRTSRDENSLYDEFTRSCEELMAPSPSTSTDDEYSPSSNISESELAESVSETFCSDTCLSSPKPEVNSTPTSPQVVSALTTTGGDRSQSLLPKGIDMLAMIESSKRAVDGNLMNNMSPVTSPQYSNVMENLQAIDPALSVIESRESLSYDSHGSIDKSYCHYLPSKDNGRMYEFVRLLEYELQLWKIRPCYEVVLSLELLRGAIISLGHTNIRALTIALLNYMIPGRRRIYPYRQGVAPPGMWPKSIPYVDPPHLASKDRVALLAWCCLNEILPLPTLSDVVYRSIRGPQVDQLLTVVNHSREHCRKWVIN